MFDIIFSAESSITRLRMHKPQFNAQIEAQYPSNWEEALTVALGR
jgi:hypothetical protein